MEGSRRTRTARAGRKLKKGPWEQRFGHQGHTGASTASLEPVASHLCNDSVQSEASVLAQDCETLPVTDMSERYSPHVTDPRRLRGREFHGSASSPRSPEVERTRSSPLGAMYREVRNPGAQHPADTGEIIKADRVERPVRPIVGSSRPLRCPLPCPARTQRPLFRRVSCRCLKPAGGLSLCRTPACRHRERMFARRSGSDDCVAVADRISARVVTICMLYHDCLLPAHGCRAVQAPVGETDGPRLWPWIRGATPPQGVWRVNSASGPTHGFIHRCFRVSDKRSASM